MNNTNSNPYKELLPPLWVISFLFFILTCWLAFQLKEILVLVVLGYSIAFVLEPAISYFEKKRIGHFVLRRNNSFFLIVALICLLITVLILTAIPTISKEYDRLGSELPNYIEEAKLRLTPLMRQLENVLPQKFRPTAIIESPSLLLPYITADSLRKFFAAVLYTLLGGYSVTLTILNLLLLPFIVYYLSVDFRIFHRQALLLVAKEQRLPVLKIAKEIHRDVSSFVHAQFIVGTILFVFYLLGFWSIGLELALFLAVVSGFGNIIPYVGTITGIILSSLIALVTFGDWGHLMAVWAVYGVVQLLEGTIITPKVMGDNVGLSPLVVLLALVICGQLLGLLGLLLAVPLTAILKVLFKTLHSWLISREEVPA